MKKLENLVKSLKNIEKELLGISQKAETEGKLEDDELANFENILEQLDNLDIEGGLTDVMTKIQIGLDDKDKPRSSD